jgi:hypothetical protein
MSIFQDIAAQYMLADKPFGDAVQAAFDADDDAAFDAANQQRKHNDQAYFLYLFTRFEREVNLAVTQLLSVRAAGTLPWTDTRIWDAWSRTNIENISFLSKVQVLTDKGRTDYRDVQEYYEPRNTIAHGDDLTGSVAILAVAQKMHDIVSRFVLT